MKTEQNVEVIGERVNNVIYLDCPVCNARSAERGLDVGECVECCACDTLLTLGASHSERR